MKKSLLCFALVLAFSVVSAQERVVSGKVSSIEDGSALPGVNVVLKGTTNGTVTDSDGNYRLVLPSTGGTLVFSFIGFTTKEIEVGDRTTVDVPLGLDVTELSEVVVTAQGIVKTRNELSYAAQTVSGESLNQARGANIMDAFSGRVA